MTRSSTWTGGAHRGGSRARHDPRRPRSGRCLWRRGNDIIQIGVTSGVFEALDKVSDTSGIDEIDNLLVALDINLQTNPHKILGATTSLLLTGIENIKGSGLADSLTGAEAEDNTILGVQGNDTIKGLSGNDVLRGWAGLDLIDGGAGHDIILIRGTEGLDNLQGGDGHDILDLSGIIGPQRAIPVDMLNATCKELFQTALFSLRDVEEAIGTSGNDEWIQD